jgi:hypothetical protein
VTSRDASGNGSTSPEGTPLSFTMPAQTTVTAFPTRTTIQSGSLRGGSATGLGADDNVYFSVNSSGWFTRVASWYGTFTGVPNTLANLAITYKGMSSQSCTQTVAVWRWTTSQWVQLDSRTAATTEVLIADLRPAGTLADLVSGTAGDGELRVRVQCTRSSSFFTSADLMKIVYVRP